MKFRQFFYIITFLLVLVFGLVESNKIIKKQLDGRIFERSNVKFKDGNNVELNVTTNYTRFFLVGDWGGINVFPYRTIVEQNVAHYMSQIAKSLDIQFSLFVGDNFYFNGVENVTDKRFEQTFESVFINLDMPFFQVLGNHDHHGNASAQIDYTQYSKRWIMPDYNYSVSANIDNGREKLVYMLIVDTVLLCGNSGFDSMPSQNVRPKTREDRRRARDYFKWIEKKLQEATAENYTYIIVVGHFPVWSVSDHGPTLCLVNNLRPLLHKYKATAYFAGHEHDMEHLRDTYLNATVDYIISGAADFPYNTTAHINDVPKGSLQFYWANDFQINGALCVVDATKQNMTITFLETTGKTLYQTVLFNNKK